MSILGNPVCMPIGGKAAKGNQMFLGVTLPRSIYYEQAAEWLKIKDDPKAAIPENQWDGQVICGNSLWLLYKNHAYAYSLENGDLLEDVTLSGASGNHSNTITTDGKNRIWFVRTIVNPPHLSANSGTAGTWTYRHQLSVYLYEFSIITKSVKLLTTQTSVNSAEFENESSSRPSITQNPNVMQLIGGFIGYANTQKLYFGSIPLRSTGGQIEYDYVSNTHIYTTTMAIPTCNFFQNVWEYDLNSTSAKAIANIPASTPVRGRFFYDNTDFFYTGSGYGNMGRDKSIFRYNKLSNTWETVTSNFEGYTDGHFSCVQLGDKMLQISQTATGVFDPKTGNLETLSVPVIPPDNTPIYSGFKAYSNNILYLATAQGIYKCPFFSAVPEDAPIVAKIYKGQKYHTLEPFEIPNKLTFLRTQQVADKDYEIKMYEYASEGGQTIFIEDTEEN